MFPAIPSYIPASSHFIPAIERVAEVQKGSNIPPNSFQSRPPRAPSTLLFNNQGYLALLEVKVGDNLEVCADRTSTNAKKITEFFEVCKRTKSSYKRCRDIRKFFGSYEYTVKH